MEAKQVYFGTDNFDGRHDEHNIIGVTDVIQVGSMVAGAIKNDNELIATRDKIFKVFGHATGQTKPWVQSALDANKMNHRDIPNTKVTGNYDAEFKRLWKFVFDALVNYGRPDMAASWAAATNNGSGWNSSNHPVDALSQIFLGTYQVSPSPTGVPGVMNSQNSPYFQPVGGGQQTSSPTVGSVGMTTNKWILVAVAVIVLGVIIWLLAKR